MQKLFEIPIYAIEKKVLKKRVAEFKKTFSDRNAADIINEKTINYAINQEIFPKCLYEYNHIVGFICIRFLNPDIVIDLYLPYKGIKKYHWNSGRKVFLRNSMLNGCHVNVLNMSSTEIASWLDDTLKGIERDHLKKSYYIDKEAFNMLNRSIDYRRFLYSKET